ncbi:MAG: metalloregulator ArsR/SmtB family transcription factor [Thaumarchaeota archaeon]|nr:metalloregulator ArsR/SmtB family transcription factor [Candidatus Calditenuaceae archaeon]MDW8041566.1 metalloregulator ArsR/SmtB family transcription factor [Nitrososphaerota archaeon]
MYQYHADFCKVFCHPVRLGILDLLRHNWMNVSELSRQLGTRQTVVSQHLAILRRVGAVKAERRGRSIYYAVADKRIIEAYDVIEEFIKKAKLEEAEILS